MAKAPRLYEEMWGKVKDNPVIHVEVTTSTDPIVRDRLVRTLRKALQKEKYIDLSFRVLYPDAKLITTILPNGTTLEVKLDKGLSSQLDQSTIFGGSNE